jgi:DNA-binding MarR family transcriptional regulator
MDRRTPPDRDAIDVVIEQWQRERPDLDLSTMGVFGRLVEVSRAWVPVIEKALAQHGLRSGEFDVLAALRRAGPPYTLIPSELAAMLMMSRAGTTSRLDRLEAAGLVARTLDPADRRSFQVALTDKGRELVDAAATDHAAALVPLLSPLTVSERAQLDTLLRSLMGEVRPTKTRAGRRRDESDGGLESSPRG